MSVCMNVWLLLIFLNRLKTQGGTDSDLLFICLFLVMSPELITGPALIRLLVNIYMNEHIEVNPSSHRLLKRRKFIKVAH